MTQRGSPAPTSPSWTGSISATVGNTSLGELSLSNGGTISISNLLSAMSRAFSPELSAASANEFSVFSEPVRYPVF